MPREFDQNDAEAVDDREPNTGIVREPNTGIVDDAKPREPNTGVTEDPTDDE